MDRVHDRVSQLSPAKRALLQRFLLEKSTGPSRTPAITPRQERSAAPLSFAQQRLWFIDQLEPDSALYNIPLALRLTGELNLTALAQTFGEIVRRHEVLRTVFVSGDGEPLQVISDATDVELPLVDLSHLSADERETEARRLANQEAQRPFDLSIGPLFRVQVLRLSATEHILLCTMHHIVSDGWSMGVLIREVAALYEAYSQGQPSPLPELPIQYADYAVWQRQWLTGEVLETQLSYWREQLAGAPAVLELPTDRPRPAVQSFRGAAQSIRLSAELTEKLRQLSRAEGVTLFMTLLSAFSVLLSRLSGQSDIVVGTPIANRTRVETEGLIGFFVNTLVLRTKVEAKESFRALLARVREVTLGAYSHQEVPFEKLVEELQPDRDLSHSPLFQVLFTLQNTPGETLELAGVQLSAVGGESEIAKLDLALELVESRDGLAGTIEYSTELFAAETIERWGGHFLTMLEAIASEPEQAVAALPLLTEEEREQLLIEWNQTAREYPRERCIHELFEEQVERTPEAVAVVYEDQQVTYAELNRRANQLAHYLRERGVGPEVLVGICVERSVEMVIGLLGILKAGGAYVPLDPEYPRERLGFMLEDARVSVLLTEERLLEKLPASEARVCCLDSDWAEIGLGDESNLKSGVLADNPCYVIYTSGSTGRPKGVLITHLSLVERVLTFSRLFLLDASHRQLQFVSLGFDVMGEEVFPTLNSGASILLHRNLPAHSAGELLLRCGELGVSKVNMPASYWHEAVSELSLMRRFVPEALKIMVTGAESPSLERLLEWVGLTRHDSRFMNVYGPTEATIMASFYEAPMDEAALNKLTKLPIGRPLANTQLYILDEEQEPVPVGVAGELYIGGVGLARGYLKRPDLTAERFVPHPFSAEPGARLYRTGDLAKYLPDGNIEFLGRIDQQIKLRGYRIELGEIETVLGQHPAVREAVVTLSAQGSEQRLVAYLVSQRQEGMPAISELRSYLKERLPEYMIPSAFVQLEELPLTPNGKIDRKRLPEPGRVRGGAEQEYAGAETPIEELLVGIWEEVLGVNRVGVHDNFFELGGHSLLATQLISRVRAAFEVEMPLRRLFEQPTIAGLARSVEAELSVRQELKAPPLVAVTRDRKLPLSYAQQRLHFIDQLEPASGIYNMPVAVRLTGELHLTALEQTFNEIVRRHEVLRTSFVNVDGEPLQVISPARPLSLPLVDLSHLAAEEREAEAQRLATAEAQRPFDLSIGPLFRVKALRLSATEHILLCTMHHIVSDGWSMGVLIREVAALYEAYSQDRPSPLPELPIQYADYSIWQREWLTGEVLESQLSYWREQLSGAPAVLELPTDRPRPAVQSFRGAAQPIQLSAELTEKLRQLSRAEGVTLFMTLLSAFSVLLSRLSGQDDIVVGTPIANRTRVETEGLIGFFVNTLVLRTKVEARESFRALLARVREVTLGAYSHQEVPFEKLVEELQPNRDLSHSPLFQVMFVLQNAPRETLRLGEVELHSAGASNETAKFDLTLELMESGEGLTGVWQYSTDLFDAATIERMSGHFQTLLEAIASEPEQRVAELEILSHAEREQLLIEWNQTAKEYPEQRCIHELFEEQVERTPEAIAVIYEDQQVTYGELNSRANQLAHYLRGRGVGPEVLVGICVERSVEMVIGLLGILKAGGAYVPLDPEYPRERLGFMLEDARVSVLLTERHLSDRFGGSGLRVVCLDADWQELERESAQNLDVPLSSEHLAYVIYTSGSTGLPKAAMIRHRSVVNLVVALEQAVYAGRRSALRVSLNAPLAFDASVKQVVQLLNGHALYIVPEEARRDGEQLLSFICQQALDVVDCTPSQLKMLMAAGLTQKREPPPALMLVGGEALDESLWTLLAEHDSTSYFNVYGPTECTVDATACSVRREVQRPVLGRPISNVEIYILDEELQPTPVGVSGHLHIGGAGLARGYLNRAGLTAERFIPHPFSTRPGARLYRTGDLARFLPDGNVEFMGRLDQQVKVRGYRIELGEIEATLMQHQDVAQTAVVVHEDGPGEKRLVAYLVAAPEREIHVGEVRDYLKSRLPDYMWPASFVLLGEMPLTRNAKIDRKALPPPEQAHLELDESHVAVRTPTQEILAGIWLEVLKVKRLDLDDDFFELGGHSLLAMQLILRVRDTFRIKIPLRSLFETPTLAGLAERIETAMQSERGLISPPIERVSHQGELPLSYAQQRLWIIDQLEPNSALYNIPLAIRLTGRLNLPALRQAISDIIRRHEVLRTTFATSEGSPVQLISDTTETEFPLVDLSHLPAEEREAQARRLANQEAQRSFDLSLGPLFRVQVLRLSQTEHILLCTMHHIVSDGWSMGVLIREVAALYEAYSQGQPSPLPELPIQYADYAVWQRQWLTGEVLETQLSYWREQLAGAPAVLELPTDHPRPAVQSFRGAAHRIELSAELTEALRKLSRAEGVTLFMTLLSAFSVLLSRLSGQDDIVVGTPIANRTRVETEGLIGFFVNTLVLRTRVEAEENFRELLRRVREVTLGAYSHQEVPFEKLVEELQPDRDLSHSPLFQVMFVLQNAPREAGLLEELSLSRVEIEAAPAKFDLTLFVVETEHGLNGALQYNTDLFNEETIERLSHHFLTLLGAIIREPEQRVAELAILTPAERAQLLVEWNQTGTQYPSQSCIHELFEEQVERTPEAIAVVYKDERMTYAELNSRANQLAHYLRGMGVGPEVMVGICVERSVEMVVGLLGILKAGGAYVPLDPEYPAPRLSFMLEDAAPALLLTQAHLLPLLPPTGSTPFCLDAQWAAVVAGLPTTNLGVRLEPGHAAYAIYTSGSTGRPKCAVNTHGGISNRLRWMQETYGLGSSDVVLQKTAFSFDVSVWEFFWPLMTGARLVVARQGLQRDAGGLAELIREQGVSVLHFVPAMLQVMLEEPSWADCRSVRLVVASGEALTPEVVERFREQSVAELENLYGPTEAAVDVTRWRCRPSGESSAELRSVPIGRPIANIQLYILDEEQEPVPVGVAGELYIGGVGLARGYLKRPELTAERFVPHPFSAKPGARLYRTGDLAKYLPDGNIEFLGRVDQQVKLRGYRIELGEIETVLGQHPEIEQAVVILSAQGSEPRLVAYVVAEQDLGQGELRGYLKERLPEYMVPAVFVQLEALPLTPNGKIDRKALPAPDQGRIEAGQEYVAPQTQVEELLVGVWEAVLGVERVGVYDNFFELGGHSLLAIQVAVRCQQAGLNVAPQFLFQYKNIAQLAAAMKLAAEKAGAPQAAAASSDVSSGDASFNQESDSSLVEELDLTEDSEQERIVPAHVFLTGATGYLGVYLLRELLEQSDAIVHCLVRDRTKKEGLKRIAEQLAWYFPGEENEELLTRVNPVVGDLQAPELGIATNEYRELCERSEIVYHSAADVRHIGDTTHFDAVNVGGTKSIIALAQTGREKILHHVSTLSINGVIQRDPLRATFSEHDFDIKQDLGESPYVRSKFLAERAVRDARAQGSSSVIHRTGTLAADSKTGRFQRNIQENAVYRFIRAAINMGVAPYLPGVPLDLVPIDFVARAIVALSLRRASTGQTFHHTNPQSLGHYDLIRTLQAFGYPISLMDPREYADSLLSLNDDESYQSELVNVMPNFSVSRMQSLRGGAKIIRVDSSFTQRWLKRLGLECPPPTAAWLRLLIQHCIEVGYVRPPKYWGRITQVPNLSFDRVS